MIKNDLSIINLTWSNVPEALGFFVYRSLNNLGRFDENSLLTKVSNPHFGGKISELITFSDDNSAVITNGTPKDVNDYDKYSLINNSFYDSSDLKATIGSFPRANEIGNKNYLEGKIYKILVYKKALNEKEVLHNYIQGSEDFTSNSARYDFSALTTSPTGGY